MHDVPALGPGRSVCGGSIAHLSLPLAAETEHEGHGNADDLVTQHEEHRRDRHHDEYHGGGDHGFLARRPRHLAGFLAHFLKEAERADPRLASYFCWRLIAHLLTSSLSCPYPAGRYLAGVAGLEPATPGFGDRCSTN